MYKHDFLRNRTLGTAAGEVKFDENGVAVDIPDNERIKEIFDILQDVHYIEDEKKPVAKKETKPEPKKVVKEAPKPKETKPTTTAKAKTAKKTTNAK